MAILYRRLRTDGLRSARQRLARRVPEQAEQFLYAAAVDGRTIGFSLLSAAAGDEAEFRIAAHPELTGRGLGKDITRATLKMGFQHLHLTRIRLIVRKNNPRAAKLYRNIGFSAAGESIHTIRGKDIEFIDMDMTRKQYNDLDLKGDA